MTRQDKDWPLCDCCLNHVAHKQAIMNAFLSSYLDLIGTTCSIVDIKVWLSKNANNHA